MSTPRHQRAAILLTIALASGSAFPQGPNLGQPISPTDIEPWSLTIMPDGTGLPPGSGTATQGEPIFAEKCALCHGVNAEGGTNSALVGGEPLTNGIDTGKTVANFWPYATTLFDFTRRAMPWQLPRTLTDEEVYALTAYVLALNDIIAEDEVMNAETLPNVQMPNRDGFIPRFPERMP